VSITPDKSIILMFPRARLSGTRRPSQIYTGNPNRQPAPLYQLLRVAAMLPPNGPPEGRTNGKTRLRRHERWNFLYTRFVRGKLI
jgi:hypothetical protein